MGDDELRWETPDGESPSRFGCLGVIPWLAACAAAIALMWWWGRTWPL